MFTILTEPAGAEGEEWKTTTQQSTRRASLEEVATNVAIRCLDVPPEWNNRDELKRIFSKFGEVTRVFPNKAKNSAKVHFKDHVCTYSNFKQSSSSCVINLKLLHIYLYLMVIGA